MTNEKQGFVAGAHAITSYGKGGFSFAGMTHQGSIIALPTGVQVWAVAEAGHIDVASLTPIMAELLQLDLILIGTGLKALPPDAPFAMALREQGARIDIMDTPAAARTYNVLMEEGRRVAAALIAVA